MPYKTLLHTLTDGKTSDAVVCSAEQSRMCESVHSCVKLSTQREAMLVRKRVCLTEASYVHIQHSTKLQTGAHCSAMWEDGDWHWYILALFSNGVHLSIHYHCFLFLEECLCLRYSTEQVDFCALQLLHKNLHSALSGWPPFFFLLFPFLVFYLFIFIYFLSHFVQKSYAPRHNRIILNEKINKAIAHIVMFWNRQGVVVNLVPPFFYFSYEPVCAGDEGQTKKTVA